MALRRPVSRPQLKRVPVGGARVALCHLSFSAFTSSVQMKSTRRHSVRRRGISRIDQPSTRTHGWFVRADFYKRADSTYAPRHRKFFGDAGYGGKRRALRAAQEYLAIVAHGGGGGGGGAKRKLRTVRRAA